MKESTLLYEVRDHIAYITLNRPERYNCQRLMEYDMYLERINEAEKDNNVRAVILSANGKHFSAGDELMGARVEGYHSPSEPLFQHWYDKTWAEWVVQGEQINPFQVAVETIANSSKLFIAVVQGLCCLTQFLHPFDFIFASEDALFTEPDVLIGQNPSGGAAILVPRILGRRRALELLLNPEPFTAQEAYRTGLINKIVPKDDLKSEATALAKKLMIYNPNTIGLIKRLVTYSQGPIHEGLVKEQMYAGFCHGMEGAGVGMPMGDNWTDVIHFPKELLDDVDSDTPYLNRTSEA